MIQLGQFAINNLAPIILAGFTIGMFTVAEEQESGAGCFEFLRCSRPQWRFFCSC